MADITQTHLDKSVCNLELILEISLWQWNGYKNLTHLYCWWFGLCRTYLCHLSAGLQQRNILGMEPLALGKLKRIQNTAAHFLCSPGDYKHLKSAFISTGSYEILGQVWCLCLSNNPGAEYLKDQLRACSSIKDKT